MNTIQITRLKYQKLKSMICVYQNHQKLMMKQFYTWSMKVKMLFPMKLIHQRLVLFILSCRQNRNNQR
ncbi:unnamed protein product [Trichobilharzia regenti]|nr:unnamed protein product [Trichobilharzia regenti]